MGDALGCANRCRFSDSRRHSFQMTNAANEKIVTTTTEAIPRMTYAITGSLSAPVGAKDMAFWYELSASLDELVVGQFVIQHLND